jgi:hypothetical protein
MRYALGLVVILATHTALADQAPAAPAPVASTSAWGPTKGAFGLTASFLGEGVPGVAGAGFSPTIGFMYFPTDALALTFDAGFAVVSGAGTTLYGMSAGIGVRIYVGQLAHLRPFLAGGFNFSKAIDNGANSIFGLGIDVGAGVQYWLSESFSLDALAVLDVPMQFQSGNPAVVSIATVTPAIGATFFF